MPDRFPPDIALIAFERLGGKDFPRAAYDEVIERLAEDEAFADVVRSQYRCERRCDILDSHRKQWHRLGFCRPPWETFLEDWVAEGLLSPDILT